MRAMAAALIAACAIEGAQAATSDLPPVGRSLFDHLTTREVDGRNVQQVPYPFESLLRVLEHSAGVDALGRPGVAAVLIPIGRSLQRDASPGRYFEHPRVVVAITGDPTHANAMVPALKDKLFLGFQAESGVLEVISYNEAAGRFEFQVVQDYRAGGKPRVRYARRALCTTCHQNVGPIFSRPGWDETNANPAVARALAERAGVFHGVRVKQGIDVPNAIDDAAAGANRIGLVQAVWTRACASASAPHDAVACRAAGLRAALRLRLYRDARLDAGSTPTQHDLAQVAAAWRAQWPEGWAEPDPNIPNRDPFFGEAQRLQPTGVRPWNAADVPPGVDPLMPRAPVARWHGDAAGVEYYVRALAEMFAVSDVARLERALKRGAARGANKAAVAFDPIDRALEAMVAETRTGRSDVLAALPFRRAATMRGLFAALGVKETAGCCDRQDLSPPPIAQADEERAAGHTPAQALDMFYRNCGVCHDSPDASPPGFLNGDAAAVEVKLTRCAPRIQYRLRMWQVPPAQRGKVPMPPPTFVPSWAAHPPRDELDRMQAYLQRLPGLQPAADLDRAYESLPPCRVAANPAAMLQNRDAPARRVATGATR